jgi:hypothetical protein
VTLIVGLIGAEGVVLASDSQATHGALKQPTPKLFRTGGLIWGTAGQLAGSQALYPLLEQADLGPSPKREEAKSAIREAMREASEDLVEPARDRGEWFEGLFGWFDAADGRHYLLSARHDGHLEFARPYASSGSSADLGSFGFNRAHFLGYDTLTLETTKMLAYTVAEDAILASARGVDLPVQMAVVDGDSAAVLTESEVGLLGDLAGAFKEHQRNFLIRLGSPEPPSSGLIPGSDS